MKTIAAIVMIVFLTGCVGITVSSDRTLTLGPKGYSYKLHQNSPLNAWNNENHIANGTQKVDSAREWCGTIIWVIIPIPLMLPVCESYIEATYVENKPVSVTAHTVGYNLYACGPFMAIMGISQSYNGNLFCGTDNE